MEGSSFVSNHSRTEGRGQGSCADKLLCNICDSEPLRDPVVTSCGHLYCWACLSECLQNHSSKYCLVCASPLFHSANFVKIYGTGCQPLDEQASLECGICLESPPATSAVATSCGHVFCWPCLYQWLHSHHGDEGPCPVCRNVLKRDVNVLPIRGHREVDAGKDVSSSVGTVAKVANAEGFVSIPPRPSPPQDATALSSRSYATGENEFNFIEHLELNEEEFNFFEDVLSNEEQFEFIEDFQPNVDEFEFIEHFELNGDEFDFLEDFQPIEDQFESPSILT